MVSWVWLLLAAWVGAIVGILALSLCIISAKQEAATEALYNTKNRFRRSLD
ncbi:MAG: hypothetical protein P4N59_17770 [Negativicutes bacterium]|nr:hypothetical protein [Negativicutes bacterium]